MAFRKKPKHDPRFGHISILMTATGLSQKSIHYYQKLGLIHYVKGSPTHSRLYDLNRTITILNFIERTKPYNFSLDEIRRLLDMYNSQKEPYTELRTFVKDKIQEIDNTVQKLHSQKKFLLQINEACEYLDLVQSQGTDSPFHGSHENSRMRIY